MYGQGPTWNTCRPAGFMSKKFTSAQQNYAVHELETLAILEALIKWEDKLISRKIRIITDHKALEFFKTQARLSNRQFRWIDYISRFDFDITYVKGEYNKVANCLSRYYENDTPADVHEYHDYVQADLRIDPTGEDLPSARYKEVVEKTVEMRAMHAMELRRSKRLQEVKEHVEVEAEELNWEPHQPSVGKRKPDEPPETQGTRTRDHPTTLGDALGTGSTGKPPGHPTTLETDDHFIQSIKDGYPNDPMFKLVIDHPEQHVKSFAIRNGII